MVEIENILELLTIEIRLIRTTGVIHAGNMDSFEVLNDVSVK